MYYKLFALLLMVQTLSTLSVANASEIKQVCKEADISCDQRLAINIRSSKSPKVNKFQWEPSRLTVGEKTYFRWDIENVSHCTSSASGKKSASGVVGPVYSNVPATSTSKWYCTDLAGNRYPSSGYLQATREFVPAPKVNKFQWEPAKLTVGEKTYFRWDIENVSHCTSSASGKKSASGVVGPVYSNVPETSTSKWYCTDLAGNRYPSSGYLQATREFVPAPKVNKFQWEPAKLTVGEKTYFRWDIENVSHCTSLASGRKSASGVVGPVYSNVPETSTSKWYCTDLAGNRYPSSGYLQATREFVPAPKVNKFQWEPSKVSVGEKTTFFWDIENVSKCFSAVAGEKEPSGQVGPLTFTVAGSSTSKWYCEDLVGGRFPETGYLEAIRTVVNNAPTIVGSPNLAGSVGSSYSFQPIATDVDGDTLVFSVEGKPSWAGFNEATGELSGIPQSEDLGVFSDIQLSVSDGQYTSTLPSFSISVTPKVYKTDSNNLYIDLGNKFIRVSNVGGKWVATEISSDSWQELFEDFTDSGFTFAFEQWDIDGVQGFKLQSTEGNVGLKVLITDEEYLVTSYLRNIIFIHTDLLGTPVAETQLDGSIE